MGTNKCKDCSEYKRCRDDKLSWVFFSIGIIATIAIRLVTVLINIDPLYGKLAWYTGVTGFFVFFAYKYNINKARADIIKKRNLVEKIHHGRQLSADDYIMVKNILCGISSRRERLNFFFIFILSAIALSLALYFDIFK